jgi:predicted nucleic acid-binding Zn ribbon protein
MATDESSEQARARRAIRILYLAMALGVLLPIVLYLMLR